MGQNMSRWWAVPNLISQHVNHVTPDLSFCLGFDSQPFCMFQWGHLAKLNGLDDRQKLYCCNVGTFMGTESAALMSPYQLLARLRLANFGRVRSHAKGAVQHSQATTELSPNNYLKVAT